MFLPPIENEFTASRALATLPYMLAMIGWAADAVLFGKLADDYGSRSVVLTGIVIMAPGFLSMGCRATSGSCRSRTAFSSAWPWAPDHTNTIM